MVVKEFTGEKRSRSEKKSAEKKRRTELAENVPKLTAAFLCGIIFSLPNGFIPVCPALCAVLPTAFSAAVFAGTAASGIAHGMAARLVTEITASAILLAVRIVLRRFTEKRFASAFYGVLAAAVYIGAGAAASIASEITAALAAAVVFRGIICGITAYFVSCELRCIETSGKIPLSGEMGVCTAVLYVVCVSSLFGFSVGSFSLGRAVGIFVILAAGGRFGGSGAAIAAVLTSLGAILGSPDGLSEPSRTMTVVGCAGLAGGLISRRGKTASAVVFTLTALFLTLFVGKLSLAAALMTDTLTAAAVYALLPDRIYMKAVNTAVGSKNAVSEYLAQEIMFGTRCLSGIALSADKAAELLAQKNSAGVDIAEAVCKEVCGECRSRAFCCKGDENRIRAAFSPCRRILAGKGFITADELPKSLDGCPKKAELAGCMNKLFLRCCAAVRESENQFRTREVAAEQLLSSVEFMNSLGGFFGGGKTVDENLSERTAEIMRSCGAQEPSAAVFFDKSGSLFISCFYRGKLCCTDDEVTEKLSALCDRDLLPPEFFSDSEYICSRWHEPPPFEVESANAVLCGSEGISGDCSVRFTDGFGNVYFVISDGMGSGNRAALESNMACSLLSKLIRSGSEETAALRIVNTLLISKSSDEVFTTADMLKINLFTGKAEFFKAGAAPSFVRTGGTVSTVESTALPLGIIPSVGTVPFSLRLSDGDCIALMSDGIPEKSYPRLRELLLSDGYSPSRCADEIIGPHKTDKPDSEKYSDDRTIFIIKLHNTQ